MSQSPHEFRFNPPPVIVDDSDPTIIYNGSWFSANIIFDGVPGVQRMPYFNTIHVLQIFSGSFSYSFTGAGISVFSTPADNSTYTSQCFLDGNEVPFDPNATKAQFGQSRPVCQAFGLPDNTVHTISVNVSVPPRQQQDYDGNLSGFAFDYMLIQPPLSSSSPWYNSNQDVLLPVLDSLETPGQLATDTGLNFILSGGEIANASRGWSFDPENGFNTTTPGSQFTLRFTGTSVWWYGYLAIPPNLTSAFNYTGTFSIDGETPLNLNMSETIPTTPSQALLFKTPALQYGNHQLTVVCDGGNDTFALTLQSLIIQKSRPTVSSSTVGPSTTISKSPTDPVMTKRGKLGSMVGGIAGGLIFLLLVAFGVYILVLRVKTRKRSIKKRRNGPIVAPEPFPVPSQGTVGILAPRKAQPNQSNVDNPFMQQELQAPPVTKWTRRHAISGSLEPMQDSPIASIQQPDLPELRINNSLVQPDDESRPARTSHVDGISTTLPAEQVEREEDSGLRMAYVPVLPPLYTTH